MYIYDNHINICTCIYTYVLVSAGKFDNIYMYIYIIRKNSYQYLYI